MKPRDITYEVGELLCVWPHGFCIVTDFTIQSDKVEKLTVLLSSGNYLTYVGSEQINCLCAKIM